MTMAPRSDAPSNLLPGIGLTRLPGAGITPTEGLSSADVTTSDCTSWACPLSAETNESSRLRDPNCCRTTAVRRISPD